MQQAMEAAQSVIFAIFACVAWLFLANLALKALWPLTGPEASRNFARRAALRPWLFLTPALSAMGLCLLYPFAMSLWLSLQDASASQFIGLSNYLGLAAEPKFLEALWNTALWLLIVPALCVVLGLVAAVVTDRIFWGNLAKSLLFMPMAISFVAASVIWKLVYETRAKGAQIGLLSAVVEAMGGQGQQWLTLPFWNMICLMAVLVWVQTGFAMVIFVAALRGLSQEVLEAALLDGATPWQIFYRIKLPQLSGTIAVVWTTITLTVLKVFDIVLTMTNGQWGTQVMAGLMFDWMFRAQDMGRASTVAVVLMAMVTPVMIWNIWRANNGLDHV